MDLSKIGQQLHICQNLAVLHRIYCSIVGAYIWIKNELSSGLVSWKNIVHTKKGSNNTIIIYFYPKNILKTFVYKWQNW